MDALAGDCCYKYMLQNEIEQMESGVFPFYLVTVSVDRIEFANKIDSQHNLKMSAYMMSAQGSTLIVKIDCYQDDKNIGDAIFIFVARNKDTHKSFKVPSMRVSKHDNVMAATESFELANMLKHWSIQKANRDMKTFIPNFDES